MDERLQAVEVFLNENGYEADLITQRLPVPGRKRIYFGTPLFTSLEIYRDKRPIGFVQASPGDDATIRLAYGGYPHIAGKPADHSFTRFNLYEPDSLQKLVQLLDNID
jgi:hypothetical protein